MKAKLFGALALAVVMIMASCKEEPEVQQVTGISIKQGTTMTMAVGEQQRLTAALEPEGVDGIVEWSTSDSTIVSVDVKGVVTARMTGTATVAASCEQFKAQIEITVKSYYEMLSFTNAILHDMDDDPIAEDTFELNVTYSDNTQGTVFAQKYWSTFWVCVDGFFVNESGYWDGATYGTVLEIRTPLYMATKELNPETGASGLVSLGSYVVTDNDQYSDTSAHVARPGKISDEGQYFRYFDEFCRRFNVYVHSEAAEDYSAAYEMLDSVSEIITGTPMFTLTYYTTDDGAPSDGYYLPRMYDGLVNSAYFSLNSNGVTTYMYGMDFFEAEVKLFDEYYGVMIDQDEETNEISIADRNLHFIDQTYQTGEVPTSSEAPKLLPVRCLKDMPMVMYSLEKQLDNKTLRVVR